MLDAARHLLARLNATSTYLVAFGLPALIAGVASLPASAPAVRPAVGADRGWYVEGHPSDGGDEEVAEVTVRDQIVWPWPNEPGGR
jgi:hypothetical protein